MSIVLKICRVCLIGLVLLGMHSSVVLAQATGSTEKTLRETYNTQLEVYRTDERNFRISRDQYTQLQTLVSLEDAVKATQKVLLSRDELLLTYLAMVREQFVATDGIAVPLKKQQTDKIDEAGKALSAHREAVARAVTREHIATVSTSFQPLIKQVQEVTQTSLTMMAYGRVQALFDKTAATRDEIKTYVLAHQPNALKLSEKQRAFEQIDQTVTDVHDNLVTMLSKLSGQDRYGSSDDAVNNAYAGLSRTLSFLNEVVKE